MSLVQRLLDWEHKDPERIWLVQPLEGSERRYSFRDAAHEVRNIAAAIRAWDLPVGSRIAISGRNTAHWFLVDLAISMAGHVTVGMFPRQGKPATDYIFGHANVRHVFLGPSLMPGDADEFAAALPGDIHSVALPYPGVPAATQSWDDFMAQRTAVTATGPIADDDLAMLIYTSGTSGNPKGVMLTHRNLDWALQNILEHGGAVKPHEVFLSYLPLAHLLERIFGEAMSLAVGAEVHFLEKPEWLADTLKHVSPTRFAGVPLVYSRIQAGVLSKLPQKKLDRLLSIPLLGSWFKRRIRSRMGLQRVDAPGVGAAPMPKDQIEWFEKLGIEIYQGYGMTENCAYATLEKPGVRRVGSVGKPLPGSGFRLSPEGEIQFKHPGVMKGYFKDPEGTREAFTPDGWLRTGDRGRIDSDGFVYITGRIKEEFKTGKGKYVVPARVEAKLARNTDLEQVCLIGVGLNQPILVATLNDKGRSKPRHEVQVELAADLEVVNSSLEDHERIAQCVIVEESWSPVNGLTTPTGKIKRTSVETFYGELIASVAERREPSVKWASDLQPTAATNPDTPIQNAS